MAPAIAVHLAAGLAALPLGAWMLARPKGTAPHKRAGRVWVALMVTVAVTSLWIPAFLAIGWIHVFTLITPVSVPLGFAAIRRGNVRRHRGCMIGAFVGLVGAALGALAPGRTVGAAMWSAPGLR